MTSFPKVGPGYSESGSPRPAFADLPSPVANAVAAVASVNLLDHQVSGPVGVGNATADTAAFQAALTATIAKAPISQYPGSVAVPAGRFLINVSNVFGGYAGTTQELGITWIGQGYEATRVQLQVGGSPIWFYDNGANDKADNSHWIRMCFEWSNPNGGSNASQSPNANGFKFTSHGGEQADRFWDCQFGSFDSSTNTYLSCGGTLFDFEGSVGNDSHKLLMCRILYCFGDVFLWNNPQAVTIELFGTNIEACYGNIFHIGSGGGGDLHVYGGDCLMDIAPNDASGTTYWHLKVDNQTTGVGLGNGHIVFHGTKFELRNPLRGIVSVGIVGQLHVKYTDVTPTITNNAIAQRQLVSIGDNCRVTFVRTPFQGPGFTSTLSNATSLSTVPVVGTTNTTTSVTGIAPSMPVGNVYTVTGSGIPATTTLTITGSGNTGTLSNAATSSVTGDLLTLTQGAFSVAVPATNSTNLPASGTLLIGGMRVAYTGFSGGGGSAITFTGCTGGQGQLNAGQSVQTASPCLFTVATTASGPQTDSISGHIAFVDGGVPEDLPYNIGFPGMGNLSATLSTGGGAITSIAVHALSAGAPNASTVTLNDGAGHTQQWTLTAQANPGDTTLTVSSQTPSFNFPLNTTGVSSPSAVGYGTASATGCHGSHSFTARHALDFDLNGRWTAQGGPSLRRKIAVVKAAGSSWPEVNIVESFVVLPLGAIVTGVYANKPANAGASSATYQLFLGSFDKSVQFGSSTSGQQKAQHIINVSNIWNDSTSDPSAALPNIGAVRLWATGGSGVETGNANGYAFVEYV